MSLSASKDGCVIVHFTRDFVSVVSLQHKRAVKKSYKKCKFTYLQLCSPMLLITILLPFYSWPRTRDFRNQTLCDLSCNQKVANQGTRLITWNVLPASVLQLRDG